MTTIVTRAGKGTPLTNNEVDTNFTNLNTDKLELGGTFSSGTANSVLFLNGSKVLTTGSALTFDGTSLGSTSAWSSGNGQIFTNATSGNLSGIVAKYSGVAKGYLYYDNASSLYSLYGDVGVSLAFSANNSEQMRLTSTGLGIGTSSPVTKLHAVGDNVASRGQLSLQTSTATNFAQLTFYDQTTLGAQIYQGYSGTSGVGDFNFVNAGAAAIKFWTTNTERMRLDASGNLGIGANAPNTILSVNAGDGVSVLYPVITTQSSTTTYGGMYAVRDGAGDQRGLVWQTFTANVGLGEKMRLDSSGNLGLGQVPAVRKFEINAIPASTSQLNGIRVQMNGVATSASEFLLGTDGGGVPYTSIRTGNDGNGYMNFFTGSGPTERMRLDASGNLGIGTSSPLVTFDVKGATDTHVGIAASGIDEAIILAFDDGGIRTPNLSYAAASHKFLINTTEQMRLNSSGNLGVGTNNPTYKLQVQDGYVGIFRNNAYNSSAAIGIDLGSLNSGSVNNSATYAWGQEVVGDANGQSLTFKAYRRSDTTLERMRIDTSGNLGLGVTPSAWGGSGVRAFDVGTGASFAGSGSDAGMIANAYYNGSNWIYKTSSLAVRYQQIIGTGAHAWFTAPSGTAGDPITFTQAMTLDASGRLLVKATSNTGTNTKLAVGAGLTSGNAVAYISTEDVDVDGITISNWTNLTTTNKVSISFDSSGVGGFRIGMPGGVNAFQIYDTLAGAERARITSGGDFRVRGAGTAGTTDAVQFSGSAPASAMILDSSGNLLVGTTTARTTLTVAGSISLGATPAGGVAGTAYSIVGNSASSGNASGGDLTVVAGGGSGSGTNGNLTLRAGQTLSTASITTGGNLILESGKPSDGQASGYIAFNGYSGSPSVATERARITSGGTFQTSLDASIYGVTVGRGAGAVSTNTAVGASALAGSNSGTGYNTGIGASALVTNSTGVGNTALGHSAMYANTTGSSNVAIGAYDGVNEPALRFNTTGGSQVAVGVAALKANTTGSNNVGVGFAALQANTTASNNTAVGYQAGYSNTTAERITAIGTQALYANTTGADNTAVGQAVLGANTTGFQNVAVGGYGGTTQTLASNTVGAYNTAIGMSALGSSTSASNNTAVGYRAGFNTLTIGGQTFIGVLSGFSNTTGWGTALGYESLYSNTTGNNSTAIGVQALYSNTTASNNTAVGYQAGYANTTGTDLVAVGYQSANNVTTGAGNVAVGSETLQAVTTGSDNIAIGRFALESRSTSSTGNVAIGYASQVAAGVASYNTSVGYSALRFVTTGANNVAVGTDALYSNTTASNNTAVGYQAGYANTTGTYNVLIGYRAGDAITTNGGNCIVGPLAGIGSTGQANTFVGSLVPGVTNGCGTAMTTGSKNTILGGFSGNQDGLDIRTASNYIVLSDGDGNPRVYHDGSQLVVDKPLTTGLTKRTVFSFNRQNEYINGIRLRTPLGYANDVFYQVTLRGYHYRKGASADLTVCWYGYSVLGYPIAVSVTTSGGWSPTVYLKNNGSGGTDIYFGIDDSDGYFLFGDVDVTSINAIPTSGWSVDDTAYTSGGVDVPYVQQIGKAASQVGQGTDARLYVTKGITFPATQNASSNANTLDDYEEGTWTPIYQTTSNDIANFGYQTQQGRYVKVGKMVTVSFSVSTINAASISGNGGVVVQGLPFPVNDITNGIPVPATTIDGRFTNNPFCGFVDAFTSTTQISLFKNQTMTSANYLTIADFNATNTGNFNLLCGSFTYTTV